MCTFFSYVSVRECINPCSEAHALLARSMNYTCFVFVFLVLFEFQ